DRCRARAGNSAHQNGARAIATGGLGRLSVTEGLRDALPVNRDLDRNFDDGSRVVEPPIGKAPVEEPSVRAYLMRRASTVGRSGRGVGRRLPLLAWHRIDEDVEALRVWVALRGPAQLE